MAKKDIVVIGASAGGMEALSRLARHLPATLPASVFVVWHMAADGYSSVLPRVLGQAGPLPAAHPHDREPIAHGRIYVAPPDHHMLLENGHVRIARGPRENRFRPAVDPLFRSAAYVYGPRVVGVVLTGALDDGTSGLWTIKMRGGTAIVQDPEEALHPSMPRNALRNVEVDHTAPLAEIAALIARLAQEDAPHAPEIPMDDKQKLEAEIRLAEESSVPDHEAFQRGELSPFTCPECHGVLARMHEGSILRFRCHTGHAFTSESLLGALHEQVEQRVWDAVRAVDETAMLLEHLAQHLEQAGERDAARKCLDRAREARERSRPLREVAQSETPA
jgi:two-component system, chemotaxis family, protein-glutamate methylesterase/glutaminase